MDETQNRLAIDTVYRWIKSAYPAAEFTLFPVHERRLVGKSWGDESATFTDFCTQHDGPKVFINVAGGKQANREEAVCREAGATIFHFALERK